MSKQTIISSCGSLELIKKFIAPQQSEIYFDQLLTGVGWRSHQIKMMGKTHWMPRLVAYYGDVPYSYSGQTHRAKAIQTVVQELKKVIEDQLDQYFNSVLLNLYRNGRDSMSWHADNERVLGENPTIVSLSLGAERRFLIRRRDKSESHDLALASGDLIIMSGPLQSHWLHSVPKTAKLVGPRINMTFRQVFG